MKLTVSVTKLCKIISFCVCCASGVTLDTHSCLDPGVPVNGIRYGQDLAIGSVVWFGCEPGYRLSHEEQLVCEKNHWWSHPLPTCDGKLSSQLHVSIRLINAAHLNGSVISTFTTISRIFRSILIEVWLYTRVSFSSRSIQTAELHLI